MRKRVAETATEDLVNSELSPVRGEAAALCRRAETTEARGNQLLSRARATARRCETTIHIESHFRFIL